MLRPAVQRTGLHVKLTKMFTQATGHANPKSINRNNALNSSSLTERNLQPDCKRLFRNTEAWANSLIKQNQNVLQYIKKQGFNFKL